MTPLLGACFGGAGFGQTVARASRSWVHDIKVETLARCGAGWQPARRLATAAVRCQRGIWPIDNRPQLAKLPHKSPRCLAYTYARIQAVLLMNRLGVHFCVAHPFRTESREIPTAPVILELTCPPPSGPPLRVSTVRGSP